MYEDWDDDAYGFFDDCVYDIRCEVEELEEHIYHLHQEGASKKSIEFNEKMLKKKKDELFDAIERRDHCYDWRYDE